MLDFVDVNKEKELIKMGESIERQRILRIIDEETHSDHGITLIGEEVRMNILRRIVRG